MRAELIFIVENKAAAAHRKETVFSNLVPIRCVLQHLGESLRFLVQNTFKAARLGRAASEHSCGEIDDRRSIDAVSYTHLTLPTKA